MDVWNIVRQRLERGAQGVGQLHDFDIDVVGCPALALLEGQQYIDARDRSQQR